MQKKPKRIVKVFVGTIVLAGAFFLTSLIMPQPCGTFKKIGLHPWWLAECYGPDLCGEYAKDAIVCQPKKWNSEDQLSTLSQLREKDMHAGEGDLNAQLELAAFYDEPGYISRFAARKYYLMAAKQGHLESQLALAKIYITPIKYLKVDYAESYFWLTVYAQNIQDPVLAEIALNQRKPDMLTAQQREDLEKRAKDWKPILKYPVVKENSGEK